MKEKLFLVIIIMLLPSFMFSEKKTRTIDVQSAVDAATKNNISLKQEELQLKESERKYKHSWNNLLPSVSAKASVGSNGSLSDFSNNSSSVDTGISANLSLNLGLTKKLESLKLSYESGKLSYTQALSQLEYEVTTSFYSLLVLENQVSINEEALNANKAQYEQTKSKKEKGLASELDLLSAQVNYETAKINLREQDTGFSVSGKKAEQIVKEWYKKQRD